MKDEYDFPKGERGKFYRPGARISVPVSLDREVLARLQERAEAAGTSVSDLINEILRTTLA